MELTETNQYPKLWATHSVPNKLIPFNTALQPDADTDTYVHFFIDDYQFDRVWRSPERYLPILSRYKGIIAPDFSLFIDMPLAMQKWNVYRNRVLAAYYANAGIDVIPSIGWGDERSYAFCFEGLPKHGTVALSSSGCLTNKISIHYFTQGFNMMMESLEPRAVLYYGRQAKKIFDRCNCRIVQYGSYSQGLKSRIR